TTGSPRSSSAGFRLSASLFPPPLPCARYRSGTVSPRVVKVGDMTVLGALKNIAVGTVGKTTDALRIGNGLDARELQPVGWFAHEQAVEKLRASYAAIPPRSEERRVGKEGRARRQRDA